MTQAIAAYGPTAGPNSSIAMMMLADIGVFAAPASRATIPKAEKIEVSKPRTLLKAFPDVEPMKNMGMIIPPLPPKTECYSSEQHFQEKSRLGNLTAFHDGDTPMCDINTSDVVLLD
jgi:hypothetical protein